MIANVNRDPKKTRAYVPRDFDPHAEADRMTNAIEIGPENKGLLKSAFRAGTHGRRKGKRAMKQCAD